MTKNRIHFRTNLLLCFALTVGFLAVAIINYRSAVSMFQRDSERIAQLTTEKLYYQSISFFQSRLAISGAMANDTMLKRFLLQEKELLTDAYLKSLQGYLDIYRERYECTSAYFVSAQTERYYHFTGQYRTLARDNPDDAWYYNLLGGTEEYSFDWGKDHFQGVMYFLDFKIYDGDGRVMGVIGVGFQMDGLEQLVCGNDKEYVLAATLVGADGASKMASRKYAPMFGNFTYMDDANIAAAIHNTGTGSVAFWGEGTRNQYYIVSQYVPVIDCFLIVENDMSMVYRQLSQQLLPGLGIVALITLFVLFIVNRVISTYTQRELKLAVEHERESYHLLRGVIKGLYADVFEFDVTRGVPLGEVTQQYFGGMGIRAGVPFQSAMQTLTSMQIDEAFRDGFRSIFSQENVLQAFDAGERGLDYECILTPPGEEPRWTRIRARLFYHRPDQSIRMLVFSEDISDEKIREHKLRDMAQRDSLTGLYNKSAVKEHIEKALQQRKENTSAAFIIADIDNLKTINDTLGHAVGDWVIKDFADRLTHQFRETDICGRIGGDEFVVFVRNIPGMEWLVEKMRNVSAGLCWNISAGRRRVDGETGASSCPVTASIGVALCPHTGSDFAALYQYADTVLYQVKRNGKNGFAIGE